MAKALYAGSFDPITKGHLDIIERASKVFEEVYVAIMVNPKKQVIFSDVERKSMIEKCISNFSNVKVLIDYGLAVDLAEKHNIKILIRGIRAISDYEYELQQASVNMVLNSKIETAFFISKPEYSFLSSSITKELAGHNSDLSKFISSEIYEDVAKKFNNE